MADVTGITSRYSALDIAPQFTNYSKVVIHLDDENTVEAGDETGRILDVDNPFGTQAMAQQMLDSLRGYQYQPYYADGAHLNPAAEIGDGVSMRGAYGGLYSRSRTFGRLMKADIAAPHDEEIDHEYKYESPTERKFSRQIGDVRASLRIANGLIQSEVTRATSAEGALSTRITQTETSISAKVSATGGVNSSFGWVMNASGHKWYANGEEIIKFDSTGGSFKGKITATSGYIGNGTNGFSIGSKAIYNGVTGMSDSSHDGVYVGTDGIRLGKGNFSVTTSGSLTAKSAQLTNATISGTLTVAGNRIEASALYNGAYQASQNYEGWNGASQSVATNGAGWSSATQSVNANGAGWTAAYNSACTESGFCYSGTNQWNRSQIIGTNACNYFESGGLSARGYFVSNGNITVQGNSYLQTVYVGGQRLSWINTSDGHRVLGAY